MALSMGYSLTQEQRMKVVMTPELRQAIHVLQLSARELTQFVNELALENPLLEIDSMTPTGNSEPFQVSEESLSDWTAYLDSSEHPKRIARQEDNPPLERMTASKDSLVDSLEKQLRCLSLDNEAYKVCQFIIGSLDEKGYLDIDPSFVCKRFMMEEEVWERYLAIIHDLEPAGIGARSIIECLSIQLQREQEPNAIALAIVKKCLLPFSEGRWAEVTRRLHCTMEEVQEAAKVIRGLNPRPGVLFNNELPQYILPDVSVMDKEGEWEIVVNEGDMPRLSISSRYTKMLRMEDETAKQAIPYIKERLQSAMWLVKNIEQRRQTLYRVTEKILAEQRDFFHHGVAYLKPLTLNRVASLLGMHESTVSRATQHKYIQTPQGVFPFRYFFPSGVMTDQGTHTSAQSVKDKIGQFIASEKKVRPLSDQRLAELLEREGVQISRRTVTKYREEMGIGTSRKRKRFNTEHV
ncbi:RNA polymerase factor sigma-54 [Marininema halotolerans]|uniref:RNA polymerase sigma-54 factor n=1 Tax=Marininema halotolerans TaxID=1155944 RepID=A0A1I6NWE0_9BACL|nr:RNA polymerase factor sigma-54 [Marininema halotolerans]SFS32210.1 RNA polymerase sigma-54 factor [Marininema halotolerans]